jgi:hypothetical protein
LAILFPHHRTRPLDGTDLEGEFHLKSILERGESDLEEGEFQFKSIFERRELDLEGGEFQLKSILALSPSIQSS